MYPTEVVPFEDAQTVLLFDTHNTIYRTIQKSYIDNGGYFRGFDDMVSRAWKTYQGRSTSIVFGWDGVHARATRRAYLPEYQAPRDVREDLFMKYYGVPKAKVFSDIRAYTKTLPHHDIESDDIEFDDLAAALVRQNPNKHFILISTDKDMWQLLVNDNVSIVSSGAVVGRAELDKAFGLTDFRQVFIFKALFGDPSDNIPSLLPRVVKKNIIEDVIKPLTDYETSNIMLRLLDCSSKRAVELTKERGFGSRLERNMAVVGFVPTDYQRWLSSFQGR